MLPRPIVDVNVNETPAGKQVDVVIRRENSSRGYRGQGHTTGGAISDAIGKILEDPFSIEWLPSK